MKNQLLLRNAGDGLIVETTYPFDMDSSVHVIAYIDKLNPTMLEAQALACEAAAAALSKYAASFRQTLANAPTQN